MLTMLVVALLLDIVICGMGVLFIRSGIRDLIYEITTRRRNNTILALAVVEILGGLVVLYLAGNLIYHVYLIWGTL